LNFAEIQSLGLRPRLYAGSVCDDSVSEATYAEVLALFI